jgi:hypothetical protein
MKTRFLAALAVIILAAAPPPVSAACNTSCSTYRTQTEMCTSCCKICYNAQGQETFNACDTRCVSF